MMSFSFLFAVGVKGFDELIAVGVILASLLGFGGFGVDKEWYDDWDD